MKYEIGDFVSKPVTGICKIEDVLSMDPMGGKNTKLYYLMKPVEDEKEKIYVAVSNADEKMRSCLTEEEAWDLIGRIPEISMEWKANERMREQEYKEAVKSNDPEVFVGIIKMIYERRKKRVAQGKKCTATDAKYFRWLRICCIWNWERRLASQSRKCVRRLLLILIKISRKRENSNK